MKALPKVIYVMGSPGAGKGTQAELLAKKLGYHQFSTGGAFRSVSQQNSDLGRRVKNLIDNGFLAPPELAAEIVIEAIRERVERGDGLIFDGTPRTVEEAAIVDRFFEEQGYAAPLAILLTVDKEEMIRRNSQRRFCLGLSQDFPIVTPEDAARCQELGGMVGSRPDDDPEKFATRWDEFQTRTRPVAERYRVEGKLFEIDGMHSIEETQAAVMNIIEQFEVHGA